MTDPECTELPVPTAGVNAPGRVVLFGGTFDPPHRAHVVLPDAARRALHARAGGSQPTWLVYVPAARSPHKAEGPIASNADRVAMLKLATAELSSAGVWTEEIDRVDRAARAGVPAEPSYSVDTVRAARAELDRLGLYGVELYLLMGADQALSFHRWRGPRELLRMCRPLVMIRGGVGSGGDVAGLLGQLARLEFWTEPELEVWKSGLAAIPTMTLSATGVRHAAAQRDWTKVEDAVGAGVAQYMRERAIY